MKGVILAAGKGTRMLPLTQRRPKPLVPVLDRPMIEHIICGARDAGFDHLGLVIGHFGDMIRDHLGDGSSLGVRIEYIWQEVAGGTGAATLLAEEFTAGEPFFLCWGDIIVGPRTYQNVARVWHEEHPRAILSLNYVDDPWEGAAVYVEDGFVTRIHEKPPKGTATTHYNNAGVFVWGPEIFEVLKAIPNSPRGEKEFTDAIQTVLNQGGGIRGVEVVNYWSDVARPATVLQLNSKMIAHRCPEGTIVDATASLAPGAELVAPVYVGPGCHVGEAVVGPDVVLAAGTRVGDGTRLTRTMTYAEALISAGCQVHDAILEERAVLTDAMALTGDAAAPAVLNRL